MINKKGVIWVSAILYIALGVVAITIVLSAGIPIINKMKDKNTVIQAKDMMNQIDLAVNDVREDGVGSRRYLTVIIKGGELVIDPRADFEMLRWKMKTNAVLIEPCSSTIAEGDIVGGQKMFEDCLKSEVVQREGSTYYYQTTTIVKDEYFARVELAYTNLDIETNNPNPLKGTYSFSVENEGVEATGKPRIKIEVI